MRYEAAGTLVTLSSAPTAIKAAASAYIDLIVKESDNNVKVLFFNFIKIIFLLTENHRKRDIKLQILLSIHSFLIILILLFIRIKFNLFNF